jgi:hypothetical protein
VADVKNDQPDGPRAAALSALVESIRLVSFRALHSSEFKLKSGINVAPYGLPPFIPF